LNSTAVDYLFGFGEKYDRRPPVFAKIPEPYNTITNYTSWPLTSDSFYVLATSADSTYFMCSMRAYLSPDCSTRYHASMTGGTLASHCEDPGDPLAYSKFVPDAPRGHYIKDWADVAAQWGIALSLNTGISEGDSSNARLLTQFIPTGPNLTPTLPSIAEGLAVLAGSTLLFSGIDAPFVSYWDDSFPFLDPQGYQTFNATVRSQDNSSGGIQRWQDLFYVILALVFFVNMYCLVYFLTHMRPVTDFMEPQNLFALSLNSPRSRTLEGTCGGGPEGKQLLTR